MTLIDKVKNWFTGVPITKLEELDPFIDSRAAFLSQKCVVEYSRARSGLLSEKLFKEQAFKEALNKSVWMSYTICYSNVAEMVEGVFRAKVDIPPAKLAEFLSQCGTCAFARYDLPHGAPKDFWDGAQMRLDKALAKAQLHPPKLVKEIPKSDIDEFFENLPVHETVRSHDFELVQNNLRINLCRIYDDFVRLGDIDGLAAQISAEMKGQ